MVTPEEIAQAMAVHSVDDTTRSHRNADETGIVVNADGDLQPVEPPADPDTASQRGTSDSPDVADTGGDDAKPEPSFPI